MGDGDIMYAEYPFKETPDKYLNDKKLLLMDSFLDNKLDELMGLYMDSFYLRDEEIYKEFKEKYNEFETYLTRHDNQELIKEVNDYLIADSMQEYELTSDTVYMESSSIDLDDYKDKMKNKFPLYIVFNNSSHWFSRIIMKMSKGNYSHVGLSFNGPSEIISFSMDDKTDGIKIENMVELISLRNAKYLKVVALPLDRDTYKEIYQSIYKLRKKRGEYKYDLKGVLMFPFRKAEEVLDWTWDNTTFFCSQFVSWVLGNIYDVIENVNITPMDLLNKVDNIENSITIFEGTADDFDMTLFSDFEDIVRDKKDRVEERAKKEVEKINLKLKQESSLFKESPNSVLNNKDLHTLTNIVYNDYKDDEYNSNYNHALFKVLNSD